MEKIKVLIVDDSVVYRSEIRAALQPLSGVEVVGVASNGKIAIERLAQIPVDLMILDLEMPEMDGIQTLTEIAKRQLKCKILVFSSSSKRGAEITMEALRLGATDFIAKPGAADSANENLAPSDKIRALLEPKIRALFHSSLGTMASAPSTTPNASFPPLIWDLLRPKIVVIGSSTGGPTVLEKIFSEISGPIDCPVIIAQHMPPVFTAALAERLGRMSGIPAGEAVHGSLLEKNRIYIVPGDYHLRLSGTAERTVLALDQGPQINSVRPAVDPLFSSASTIFKSSCLGIVLTGMGADGKVGAEEIKQRGGAVVIQSQASCVVFGMPGAVFACGAYDRIGTPQEIIAILREKVAGVVRAHAV